MLAGHQRRADPDRDEGLGEFVETVVRIAPAFGAVHLEDIPTPSASPSSGAIEERRKPVMHDDHHGTAVAVLAAL